ncbi:protein Shroom [Leptopilina heterotoma]|uniref:protein Shroom n=1 Tax=Leptopilina heterotoma TaxID=63436 RepID=UPI001CA7CEA3|nr:protein Shroom [Leptopilina heterotoma]
MTELQPSPPGYRGQDEAPGPPGSFKYTNHGHVSEVANYKGTTTYPQEGYNLKSTSRSIPASEYYRRRNDNSRRSTENDIDNENLKKASNTGYNDGYKKNTPGYKNDSGYSESIGFDSFSLPLNERDESSPPPTPPVRDASSLKSVCYGPGHEKYPSWPSAPERHPEEEIHTSTNTGSHRSKSWTDHTNYPKEKPAQYTRPHNKRPNPTFTQQLKTVMERCEKIPAETFESRNRSNSEDEPRLWPRVDREGKPLGDSEYVVPSPPEREQATSQTLSHADLEAYVRSYQDPQTPQVDIYRETTLTQAGLEEYTRVQHSQQASYAQSEGYHSYVSSVDSTTNTPFLDRLRRDSEAVAQRPTPNWEEGSREGRDSVVTTSSGSASSSETLKWHGSMSDVSVSSGMPPRQVNSDRWHHGSMSDVSSVNGGLPSQQPNHHDKWQGSMSDVSTVDLTPTKMRHSEKWMNDRNKQTGRTSLPSVIGHCLSSLDVCQQTNSNHDSKWLESSIDGDRSKSLQWDQMEKFQSYQARQQTSSQNQDWNPLHGSMSDVSLVNGVQGSKQLIAHSARVQTPQRHHSESVLYLDRERSQRKLYPVNTTQPTDLSPTSRNAQLSVAERISELEKQQQMRYTYLDPEKRHRVSDPTLKAIQKKALLSFYERHHQTSSSTSSWRSEPQLTQGSQAPPPQPPPRPRPPSSRRASSASDYATGNWREKITKSLNSELPSPKHQHSNSCGSLSTDLLGPVIVGPAISIDDWVPERPPKKPHLRNYNDRLPSPDLPPPSPPTITENEVICDDPLPPPPSELSDDSDSNRSEQKTSSPRKLKSKSDRNKQDITLIENGIRSTHRSSLRYSQKIVSMKQTRKLESRPPAQLPDLITQRYEKSVQGVRPNYLPIDTSKSKNHENGSHNFSIGSPVKTGYEANSKHFLEGSSPQKYHEPPKYVPNHHSRHGETTQRNYYALPPKYVDPSKPKATQCPSERYNGNNLGSSNSPPPPLAPRQNTPGRKSLPPPPRPAPPHAVHGSQSKASYLAYRRERGVPDNEGSYKRTMSPTARLDDWPRDRDDPVLLRVTPHHPHSLHQHHNHHQQQQQQQHHDLSKSHSVDALHQRIDNDRQNNHSTELISKDLTKKLQTNETRLTRTENNNIDNIDDLRLGYHTEKKERLSPQSIEVLNDRNRQLERERRKLAANCETTATTTTTTTTAVDFYRERSATIEMTSQNVELLNRRNAGIERRSMSTHTNSENNWSRNCQINDIDTRPCEKPPPPSSSPPRSPNSTSLRGAVPRRTGSCSSSGSSSRSSDLRISPSTLPSRFSPKTQSPLDSPSETLSLGRKVSSPTQTDNNWDKTTNSPISSSRIRRTEYLARRSSSSRSLRIHNGSTVSSSSSTSLSSSSTRNSPTQDSPCVSPQPGIEGLTLVQRTEIVLRVNATTIDAASQTEIIDDLEERFKMKEILPEPRKKLPEEIECEELSRELASQLSPNDKLVPILVPVTELKKSTDYVSGLFRVEATLQPRSRRRLSLEESTSDVDKETGDVSKIVSEPATPVATSIAYPESPLSPTASYFTTSEGKGTFLTRYSQEVVEETLPTKDETTTVIMNSVDLRQKKEELMIRLDKKLVVLRAEEEAVREEGELNEALGARVAKQVASVARPAELSKYRLHVEEVGKITSLLLGLSGRLARAENTLHGMPADHAERKILESKRDKLIDQLEEAKILKGNIDKRSVSVSAILSKYLNNEEFTDYQHFINMKAKLIMDGREIQDKVKLGEEQLVALKETID